MDCPTGWWRDDESSFGWESHSGMNGNSNVNAHYDDTRHQNGHSNMNGYHDDEKDHDGNNDDRQYDEHHNFK